MAVRANEITKHLSGMDFPADKTDLEDHAEGPGAETDILDAIRGLPGDGYPNLADVMNT